MNWSLRTYIALGLYILLALALGLAFRDDRTAVLLTATLGIVGAVMVLIAGAGLRLSERAWALVRSAARRVRNGQVPEIPPELPQNLAALYEELAAAAEQVTELRERVQSQEAATREQLHATREAEELLATTKASQHENTLALRALTAEAAAAASSLADGMSHLSSELEKQSKPGEAATKAIREVLQSAQDFASHVEVLAGSAEESSSSILEMSATNEQVATNIGELAASVRETVASIEEMTYSIREVAKNTDALSLTAEETSTSMNQMDVSIDQVQSNANETARLSEEVAQDAERGAEAILKTIGEIYRIKESSQLAVSVISDLGSRIDAIGQILSVIDEVAEQTNLLALNAAIIAAQAGEHGKGFAVVADEIKDLAERAGASTREIADLIKTIQSESRNAIQAVEQGAENVDRGVQVSNEAERALKKILESSQQSTHMVRAIARATVEQSKGSKQVTDAIGRIAETTQQIAAATAQQARGSELIMKSGDKMRTISQQVERSSEEQTRGGRQVTQAIENINGLVHQLNLSQLAQVKGSEQALGGALSGEEASMRQVAGLSDLLRNARRLQELLSKRSPRP